MKNSKSLSKSSMLQKEPKPSPNQDSSSPEEPLPKRKLVSLTPFLEMLEKSETSSRRK